MEQKIRHHYRRIVGLFLLAFLMAVQLPPLNVSAADRNLEDVQFTTGKYGQNCLTAANWSESDKTLNLTQNVYLDAAAQQRVNQGELKLNASVKVGANGSRTNTRKLEVKCFDKNGNQVGSTWKTESKKFSSGHHWNTLSLNDKSIPKNTYRIQYYVYNHIGTSGALEIENCSLVIRDEASPKIVNLTASTDDGRAWNQPHPAGTKVTYTIYFSERISASIDLASDKGAPWIEPYSSGVSTSGAKSTGDGASSTVSYTYTIPKNGDVISDNHTVAFRGISAFSVWDDAGNTTTVGLTEDDVKKLNSNLASGGTLRMDNRPPELTGITSEGFSKDTVLKAGDTVKLHLKFHENIKISGTNPEILLSNGKHAEYIPTGTTTDIASFSYTVSEGDDINDLAISDFNLSGIVDGVNQSSAASVRYTEFTTANKDYMEIYGVNIDTMAPKVTLPEFEEGWKGKNLPTEIYASDNVKDDITGSGVRLVRYAWSQQAAAAPDTFTDLIDSESGIYAVPAPASGGNWYLWTQCQDEAGNISEPVCSAGTAQFDVTAPEITWNTKELDGKVIGVTVSFSDSESGVALRKYVWFDAEGRQVDVGELEEGMQPPMPGLTGTYVLKLYSEDAVGNSIMREQEVFVDRTAPEVVLTCDGEGYAKAHTIQAECTDGETRVELMEYQWKQGMASWVEEDWRSTTDLAFETPEQKDGEWRLYVRATDAAGNQNVEFLDCMLDNTAPEISMTPDGNAGNVGAASYMVVAEVTDMVTPRNLLSVEYGLSSSEEPSSVETWTKAEEPSDIRIKVTLAEDTYLHIRASDEAGNTGIKTSQVFVVDRKAPEGSIQLEGKTITNRNSVNLLMEAADDYTTSEDIQVQFLVDQTPWSEWESFGRNREITFEQTEGEHTIAARFKDRAGNVSEQAELTVVYDITPPVITLSYSCEERTSENVVVTATLSDGSWLTADRFEFTANGKYTFQAEDEAGNLGTEVANVTWIDKTPPEFTVSSEEADAKPHKTASFTAVSDDTDLAGYFYRIYLEGNAEGDWKKMDGNRQELPELADGTYIVEVYAEDDLGNRSASRTLTILLDNTPPEATVSYLPEGRTSENVTATLSLADASAVTVTKPEDGSFAYTFEENDSFTFEFTDAAGNTGSIEAKVEWIDRTLPSLDTVIESASGENLPSGAWTNEPVKVTLMRTHAAQKYDQLTFNGQDIMGNHIQDVEGIALVPNESDTYLVSTYGVLEYQITDTQTNLTSSGSLLLAVDTQNPSCPDEAVQYSTKGWTNQDVTVRISAQDDLAKTITYLKRIVDEEEKERFEEDPSGDTFVFDVNGEHTFYFKDQAGNMESKTVRVDWIDKEKPKAKVTLTTEDGFAYRPADWTNQSVTAQLEFESASPVTMLEGEDSYLFTANGSHTFTYIDAAGNQNTTRVTLNRIDKVAPTGYMTAAIEGWTNQNVEVTLHASDDASGAEDMVYEFTENGSYTFALKDKAGNEASYTYVMDRIDKQAPEIQLFYTPDNVTKTPFSVYVSASADERVTWKNNTSSHKFTENGDYTFEAIDRGGNKTTKIASVDWISPDLPEVQLNYSTMEPTNQDVLVELRATDENAFVRALNNNGSRFYTFRENGSFTFQYTDAAGKNIGEITAQVTWIDKVGPRLTIQADRTELGKDPVKVTITADEPVIWPNGMIVLDDRNAAITYTQNTASQIWMEDALGNKSYAQIVVDCIDNTAPVIVMENEDLCIPLGQSFDPMEGVKAEDEHPCEAPFDIEGSVDTKTAGEYVLHYTAVDLVGNTATKERVVYVYDPEQFHVQINGKLYMGRTIFLPAKGNEFTLVHAEGAVSVRMLKGKAVEGDFKTKGDQIAESLLDGSYTFPGTGYYTLLVQDQERNTKLVQLFVAE